MMTFFSTGNARLDYRNLSAVLCIVCVGLVGAAVVIGRIENLEPCPLCILQRIVYLLLALLGLIGWFRPPQTRLWRGIGFGLALLLALSGAAVAGWHVYLQYSPPEVTCGPDLQFMIRNWPPGRWLPSIFKGGGECSDIDWSLLGLSMPAWSTLCFALMAGFSGYMLRRQFTLQQAG